MIKINDIDKDIKNVIAKKTDISDIQLNQVKKFIISNIDLLFDGFNSKLSKQNNHITTSDFLSLCISAYKNKPLNGFNLTEITNIVNDLKRSIDNDVFNEEICGRPFLKHFNEYAVTSTSKFNKKIRELKSEDIDKFNEVSDLATYGCKTEVVLKKRLKDICYIYRLINDMVREVKLDKFNSDSKKYGVLMNYIDLKYNKEEVTEELFGEFFDSFVLKGDKYMNINKGFQREIEKNAIDLEEIKQMGSELTINKRIKDRVSKIRDGFIIDDTLTEFVNSLLNEAKALNLLDGLTDDEKEELKCKIIRNTVKEHGYEYLVFIRVIKHEGKLINEKYLDNYNNENLSFREVLVDVICEELYTNTTNILTI